MLARLQGASAEHDLSAGRHGYEQIGGQSFLSAPGDACTELLRGLRGPMLVDVPQHDVPAAGEECPCGCLAVHAGADHGCGRRVSTAQRLGCEHCRGARSKRGDGARVEDGAEHPVRRVGHEHDAHHGREARGRIAGI